MNYDECASVIACGAQRLVAIISRTREPSPRGVLIIVGGPQYRAGSHRQFTLLSRALAGHGFATMRFDYRGMGDSEGPARDFEEIQDDIQAAISHFCAEVPELREVVIWGLCDAASAGLMQAHRDKRVTGLVLLNPWVRTPEGLAKTQLKRYYWSRLIDRDFWRKLGRGEVAAGSSLRSLAIAFQKAFGARLGRTSPDHTATTIDGSRTVMRLPLPERMAEGMSRFEGKVLLILSGNDITAQEFEEIVLQSRRWRRLLSDARVERRKLADANHTFSRAEWRNQVALWTVQWLGSW